MLPLPSLSGSRLLWEFAFWRNYDLKFQPETIKCNLHFIVHLDVFLTGQLVRPSTELTRINSLVKQVYVDLTDWLNFYSVKSQKRLLAIDSALTIFGVMNSKTIFSRPPRTIESFREFERPFR